jgi:hypothetical protein
VVYGLKAEFYIPNNPMSFIRRGWPESANTWEPLENLKACSDIVDAFDKRYKCEALPSSALFSHLQKMTLSNVLVVCSMQVTVAKVLSEAKT